MRSLLTTCSKKRPNILVSTTSGWNPGDDFIREGIRRITESVLGCEANWFIHNRNPDMDGVRVEPASNHVGSSHLDMPWGLVVFAGTPEWDSWRTQPVLEHLARTPELPVMFFGIGSANLGERPGSLALEVMRSARTLVICRNIDLNQTLTDLGVTSRVLPCPGFLCQEATNQQKQGKLLVFQDSVSSHVKTTEPFERTMLEATERGWTLVCHARQESFRAMQKKIPFIYDNDYHRLMKLLASSEMVVSTRLHGAIAAASSLTPSIITGSSNNFRVTAAAAPLGMTMINDPKEAIQTAEYWLTSGLAHQEKNRLASLRSETESAYREVLRQFLWASH